MTFWQIANLYKDKIPVFVEIYNRKLLIPSRDSFESGIDVIARWDIATERTRKYMQLVDDECVAIKMETYLNSQILGGGPKIFRPTSEQLFALEKMRLNIQVTDFKTPYSTMVVELPEEYRKARSAEANCSVLHLHAATKFFIHSLVYDITAYKTWWPAKPHDELETWFAGEDIKTDFGDLKVMPDEVQAEMLVRRATLNYCLLLDEIGVREIGPQVPNQYNQLVKWCQKRNEHTERNKIELQAQPKLYCLDKLPTNLVRVVGSRSELPPAETGRVVSPHSRRGHYRMQPYGPKNEMRKRIRIPPTIINAHLLLGGEPGATYQS